jgi:hypothetical protein
MTTGVGWKCILFTVYRAWAPRALGVILIASVGALDVATDRGYSSSDT